MGALRLCGRLRARRGVRAAPWHEEHRARAFSCAGARGRAGRGRLRDAAAPVVLSGQRRLGAHLGARARRAGHPVRRVGRAGRGDQRAGRRNPAGGRGARRARVDRRAGRVAARLAAVAPCARRRLARLRAALAALRCTAARRDCLCARPARRGVRAAVHRLRVAVRGPRAGCRRERSADARGHRAVCVPAEPAHAAGGRHDARACRAARARHGADRRGRVSRLADDPPLLADGRVVARDGRRRRRARAGVRRGHTRRDAREPAARCAARAAARCRSGVRDSREQRPRLGARARPARAVADSGRDGGGVVDRARRLRAAVCGRHVAVGPAGRLESHRLVRVAGRRLCILAHTRARAAEGRKPSR